ncbi:ABC transporter ATP-binding protein [Alicyclobacillus fructus]|uniref:ABC transporter ATP-binding protein n=1 Tax=Alicyclobacillus fructus TaxID=2816082 RepID=UPI001F216703|nr:ABC transporter ATP-binding protein [Alicyclobacillus fructus]
MDSRAKSRLVVSGVTVFHGRHAAVRSASISVGEGELVALVGPSGSGKSTLIGAIAGFYPVASGAIWIQDQLVAARGTSVPPERRQIGVVFQSHALWPQWMVIDNVAYPLRRQGLSRIAARREAEAVLAAVGLEQMCARFPGELSGGQRQRVGLARALAARPLLYLFDEPTANLDPENRQTFADEVRQRLRHTGASALYVSHQVDEALALADRVAVMLDGAIVQAGSPQEVYERPRSAAVARLLGHAACVEGVVTAATGDEMASVQIADSVQRVRLLVPGGDAPPTPRVRTKLMFRPEWCRLAPDDVDALPCRVAHVRYLGHSTLYELESLAGRLLASHPGPPRFTEGDRAGWLARLACLLAE